MEGVSSKKEEFTQSPWLLMTGYRVYCWKHRPLGWKQKSSTNSVSFGELALLSVPPFLIYSMERIMILASFCDDGINL